MKRVLSYFFNILNVAFDGNLSKVEITNFRIQIFKSFYFKKDKYKLHMFTL